MRDRCFTVPSKGGGTIRIRASKRPSGKTLEALQDLFEAAYRYLAAKQLSVPEPSEISGLKKEGVR